MNTIRDDLNIAQIQPLISPEELKNMLPLSEEAGLRVIRDRQNVMDIMNRKSKRFLVIIGPCSIHNTDEAIEYAAKLKSLSTPLSDKLMVIMRDYFEKPRTTIGWKGLIYDPDLNSTYQIEKGLKIARELLLKIDEIGVSTATEILDPVTAQYIADLIVWAAIGARTTESQTHRQLASGMSMPIGFKNTTDGNIHTAIEAISTAKYKHAFLGLIEDGRSGIFHTKGNQYAHLVLRGGKNGPNYTPENIAYARVLMERSGINPNIIVDCSHANSNKTAKNQAIVLKDVLSQLKKGEKIIVGVMIESNLRHGTQPISEKQNLKYGISITDECIGWDETEDLVKLIYSSI